MEVGGVAWRWAALVGLAAVTLPGPASGTAQASATGTPAGTQTRTASGVAAAAELHVEVLASYPHDTAAFTEGLELHDGLLYESTGLWGQSDIRTVRPETGEVLTRVALPDTAFGEGITAVGQQIWQLTFLEKVAFLRDRATLAETGQAGYTGEGWGLCNDPENRRLVMSNGTPELTFRDPVTFEPLGTVAVTLDGEPLFQINELECVAGKVWANVWASDQIVRIDPATGVVDTVVDAAGLLTDAERANADVLNGIAAVPCTDTFLLTGKMWPHTFLVRFS